MAVNRLRGAFAVPRKGETFELRAGLVSESPYPLQITLSNDWLTDLNMHTSGKPQAILLYGRFAEVLKERKQYKGL